MKISEKYKYYLLKAYNALKITGNICALIFLCLVEYILALAVPKGVCSLARVFEDSCMSWFAVEQAIFILINLYLFFNMAEKVLKIQSLKYHIAFWLTPIVLLFLEFWLLH